MTNLLATPQVKNEITAAHSRVRSAVCTVVPVVADVANHYYVLFRVSAHARLLQLWVTNTADAGLTDCNVGVYAGDADGQTSPGDWTVDQPVITSCGDILADGLNRSAGSTIQTEVLGSAGYTADLHGTPLWQLCATVSAAPPAGTMYDIVMQSIGNPAGCTMVWTLIYTAGD